MTPENIRFHAAGHIAAAHAVAQKGDEEGARVILGIVKQYTERPTVSAPPAIGEMLTASIEHPGKSLETIAQLEAWFVDPFNTVIEKSGARFT